MANSEPTAETLHVRVNEHERRLGSHDKEFDRHTELITKIQNRPPVWITMIVTILTGLLCTLAGAVGAFMLIGS